MPSRTETLETFLLCINLWTYWSWMIFSSLAKRKRHKKCSSLYLMNFINHKNRSLSPLIALPKIWEAWKTGWFPDLNGVWLPRWKRLTLRPEWRLQNQNLKQRDILSLKTSWNSSVTISRATFVNWKGCLFLWFLNHPWTNEILIWLLPKKSFRNL